MLGENLLPIDLSRHCFEIARVVTGIQDVKIIVLENGWMVNGNANNGKIGINGFQSTKILHTVVQIEEVNKVGGLDLVFKALEASPMVKELDGQRGEKAQREFLRRRRQASESMESFIMRVQAQRSVMEEEDSTFAVCDRFLVGYILDHAELTLKDRVMVLAAAQNQMTSDSIFPALRRMGPFL